MANRVDWSQKPVVNHPLSNWVDDRTSLAFYELGDFRAENLIRVKSKKDIIRTNGEKKSQKNVNFYLRNYQSSGSFSFGNYAKRNFMAQKGC